MFGQLLERSGITKAELSRRLGLRPETISQWKSSPSQYAITYLELLIEYNRVRP